MDRLVMPDSKSYLERLWAGNRPIEFYDSRNQLTAFERVGDQLFPLIVRNIPIEIETTDQKNRVLMLLKGSFVDLQGRFANLCPRMKGGGPHSPPKYEEHAIKSWLENISEDAEVEFDERIEPFWLGIRSLFETKNIAKLRLTSMPAYVAAVICHSCPFLSHLELNFISGLNEDESLYSWIEGKPFTRLSLRNCSLDEDGLVTLLSYLPQQIRELDVADNVMGDAGANKLAEWLLRHNELVKLNVSRNNISNSGVRSLAKNLPKLAITHLTLAGNSLGASAFRELASAVTNQSLIHLDLEECEVTTEAELNEGIIHLANSLKGSRLVYLQLAFGHILDQTAVEALAENIPLSSLIHLSLKDHGIPHDYVSLLRKSVLNSQLENFEVTTNCDDLSSDVEKALKYHQEQHCQLLSAVARGDIGILKTWLQTKAPLLLMDKDGNTLLHLAVRGGHKDLVTLLLQAGLQPVCNDQLMDPLDLARGYGFAEIVTLLRQAYPKHHESASASDETLVYRIRDLEVEVDKLKLELSRLCDLQASDQQVSYEERAEQNEQLLEELFQGCQEGRDGLQEFMGQIRRQLVELEAKASNIPDPSLVDQASQTQLTTLQQEIDRHRVEIQQINVNVLDSASKVESLQALLSHKLQLQQRLTELFALDGSNPNRPIESFYHLFLTAMISFTTGVLALDSKLVPRRKGWKDDAAHNIFGALGFGSSIAAHGGAMAFGGAALIPFLVNPIVKAANMAWDKYRDNKKDREVHRAVQCFSGGYEAIDYHCRNFACDLAYLLQLQLPLCTPKGLKTIASGILYQLAYNVMKTNPNVTKDQAKDVATSLVHIAPTKLRARKISTHQKGLKWNTRELLTKAGCAFKLGSNMSYYTVIQTQSKPGEPAEITNVTKYGYHVFRTDQDGICYQQSKTLAYQSMKKINARSGIRWEEHLTPRGPVGLVTAANNSNSQTPVNMQAQVDRPQATQSRVVEELQSKVIGDLRKQLQEQADLIDLILARLGMRKPL